MDSSGCSTNGISRKGKRSYSCEDTDSAYNLKRLWAFGEMLKGEKGINDKAVSKSCPEFPYIQASIGNQMPIQASHGAFEGEGRK